MYLVLQKVFGMKELVLEDIKSLIDKHYMLKDIAKEKNVNRNTVWRFMRKHNLKLSKVSKRSWSDETLISAYNKAVNLELSKSDIVRLMGLKCNTHNKSKVYEIAKSLGLDLTILKQRKVKEVVYDKPECEVLTSNSNLSTTTIRTYVLYNKLIEYSCNLCDIVDKWLDSDLVLQLDHIDGVNNNHAKENLRFLCPNCHSQTKTWGGRNTSKNSEYKSKNILSKEKPSNICMNCKSEYNNHNIMFCSISCKREYDTIKLDIDKNLDIINSNSLYKAAKLLGFSDNGLKKRLIKNGYTNNQGYWSKT